MCISHNSLKNGLLNWDSAYVIFFTKKVIEFVSRISGEKWLKVECVPKK